MSLGLTSCDRTLTGHAVVVRADQREGVATEVSGGGADKRGGHL